MGVHSREAFFWGRAFIWRNTVFGYLAVWHTKTRHPWEIKSDLSWPEVICHGRGKTKNSLVSNVFIVLSGKRSACNIWGRDYVRLSLSLCVYVTYRVPIQAGIPGEMARGNTWDVLRMTQTPIACICIWLKFMVLFISANILVKRLSMRYNIYHGVPVRVVQCHSL